MYDLDKDRTKLGSKIRPIYDQAPNGRLSDDDVRALVQVSDEHVAALRAYNAGDTATYQAWLNS